MPNAHGTCGPLSASYQYLVILSTGESWLRREHLVLKSYRSPTPEILNFAVRMLEYYDGVLQ